MRPDSLAPIEVLAQRRSHGDRIKYISGCRCVPCRAANSRYETQRVLARARGQWNGLVPASHARAHVRSLSRAGVGYKTVAHVAGVARSTMMKVRSGERRHIRASAERRILSVTADAARGSSLVSAAPAWRMLEHLQAIGFTKTFLAARLGSRARTPALQLRRDRITASNLDRVRRLYRDLYEIAREETA